MTDKYKEFCRLRDFREPGEEAPKHTEREAFALSSESVELPSNPRQLPSAAVPVDERAALTALEQVMRPYGIYDTAFKHAGALQDDFMAIGKQARAALAASQPAPVDAADADGLMTRMYARHKEWADRSGHAPMGWEDFQISRLENPLSARAVQPVAAAVVQGDANSRAEREQAQRAMLSQRFTVRTGKASADFYLPAPNDCAQGDAAGQQAGELPPLPTPNPTHYREHGMTIERMEMYTAEQMQAYARTAIAQRPASAAPSDPRPLFDRKLANLEQRGYAVVGRILHKDGEYALFDSSCRWLTQPQYWRLMHEQDGSLFAEKPAIAAPVKDHVLREVVNSLRDTAIKFHNAQQLRERLRGCLDPLLDQPTIATDSGRDAEPAPQQASPDAIECIIEDWCYDPGDVPGKLCFDYADRFKFASSLVAAAQPDTADVRKQALEDAIAACMGIDVDAFGVFPVRVIQISEACATAIRALNDKKGSEK